MPRYCQITRPDFYNIKTSLNCNTKVQSHLRDVQCRGSAATANARQLNRLQQPAGILNQRTNIHFTSKATLNPENDVARACLWSISEVPVEVQVELEERAATNNKNLLFTHFNFKMHLKLNKTNASHCHLRAPIFCLVKCERRRHRPFNDVTSGGSTDKGENQK